MFVDNELVEYITKNFGINADINEILDNCGVWLTLEELSEEWGDPVSLEEAMSQTYYIVDKNKMLFSSDNILDDICEYYEVE